MEEEEAAAGGAPTAAWAEDDDEKKAAEEDGRQSLRPQQQPRALLLPLPLPKSGSSRSSMAGRTRRHDHQARQADRGVLRAAFRGRRHCVGALREPATQQQPFFTEDHFYMRTQDVVAEKFDSRPPEVAQIEVQLGFGLKRNDPWDLRNVHSCEVSDETPFMKTRSKLKDGFDLANHQQGLLHRLQHLRIEARHGGRRLRHELLLLIDQFKDWAMEKG